ncbi:hypothetical protein F5B21DRAFT_495383 [Xylaria acuta]|nr:hypothetical protein F5B21DRAFT_495383 [Xylaria acuta]
MENVFELNAPLPCYGGVGTENSGIPPFVIDLSDSEDEDAYSPPPAKTAFTREDTRLPAHGSGVEDVMKDSFELNTPLPLHSDVEYLVSLLDLGGCVAASNGDVPPVSIDTVESEEDVYSPIYAPLPAKNSFTTHDTQLPAHGATIEDTIGVGSEFSAPFLSYPEVEDATSLLGLAGVGNGGIPRASINVAEFEKDTSSPVSAKTTFTGRHILLAEQVESDQVTVPKTDDDVIMVDVEDDTNINDILGCLSEEKVVVVTTTGDEKRQVPVLLDGGKDFPTPSWMAGFFQPGFLRDLMVCNLKEITLESDKIHFSFA